MEKVPDVKVETVDDQVEKQIKEKLKERDNAEKPPLEDPNKEKA